MSYSKHVSKGVVGIWMNIRGGWDMDEYPVLIRQVIRNTPATTVLPFGPLNMYSILNYTRMINSYNIDNKYTKEKFQASSIECIGSGAILVGNYPRKKFPLAMDNGKILSKTQGTQKSIFRNGVLISSR